MTYYGVTLLSNLLYMFKYPHQNSIFFSHCKNSSFNKYRIYSLINNTIKKKNLKYSYFTKLNNYSYVPKTGSGETLISYNNSIPFLTALSPNIRFIAICLSNGLIDIFSLKSFAKISTINAFATNFYFEWFPDENQNLNNSNISFLSCTKNNKIYFWNNKFKIVSHLKMNKFIENGRRFLTFNSDTSLYIRDIETCRLISYEKIYKRKLINLDYDKFNNLIGLGYDDGSILIWDNNQRKITRKIFLKNSKMTNIRFLKNKRSLLISNSKQTLFIWDFDSNKKPVTLRSQNKTITGISTIFNSRINFITTERDGLIKIWSNEYTNKIFTKLQVFDTIDYLDANIKNMLIMSVITNKSTVKIFKLHTD
ncbi:nucleolar rRNA processing protein (nucleomorph) [Bigelowiella natans]|uniref:Nucleolar rRNA processing protein n=1 Tax=Bigelowiella natans TaxID=227086 RepID=Q3LWL4_BIGNA|nr:nucleolar rRNA processing protein [Bigelowiella natans]ABA27152.1 nucleolar rRNA processing protein [Bigelowiella natans]